MTITNDFNKTLILKEVKGGDFPAVIIINGFLSGSDEKIDDWLLFINELYPKNKVYHAKWNAGDLLSALKNDGLFSVNKRLLMLASSFKLKAILAATSTIAVNKIAGLWSGAFNETRRVGQDLSVLINKNKELHGCILMGHSLGARVVYHTLSHLDKSVVSASYLLAGAVSSEENEWKPVLLSHKSIKIINCMSNNDFVLKTAYKIGCLFDHKPIGLFPLLIKDEFSIFNVDVSKYASGHLSFKNKEMGRYLNKKILEPRRIKQRILAIKNSSE
ncbi:DUF726 domain-containing protein [Marinomonas sp. IMCC 4694]|uniref:DUF726 domain-containing protein n=1 Tax=Marinomonas sp. IMCC 4694 TaxID=2605432 RepID=UPI0011E692A5|nr:DUF726 domain-containing protein [Marinomonas sp. IMCC 4694]TYL47320.1 DUF726 domain-containing protein [Marinomonas sp. IMCC 4694]